MTIEVVWVTDTLTIQPAIEQAVAHLNAHLVIVTNRASMPPAPIDLLIWSPTHFDQADYEQIRPSCLHMVICEPRGLEFRRWYPRYDPRWPSYLVIIPFDADEFAFILQSALRGPPLAPFEAERED